MDEESEKSISIMGKYLWFIQKRRERK